MKFSFLKKNLILFQFFKLFLIFSIMETQINDNTDEYDREFINLIIGKINKKSYNNFIKSKN